MDPLPASIVAALTENAQMFGRIRPGEGERTLTRTPRRSFTTTPQRTRERLICGNPSDVKLDISGTLLLPASAPTVNSR